jgi:hypothetical protein
VRPANPATTDIGMCPELPNEPNPKELFSHENGTATKKLFSVAVPFSWEKIFAFLQKFD